MVFNRARLWARSLILRRRLEQEMQKEMAEHLQRSTERLIARGLSQEEAKRAALREFGNVGSLQEQSRDARGTGWLDAVVADVRFAFRQFARRAGTTATMLVVLAVGMGITTLLFSYVYAYANQPPPGIALEEDLVRIRGSRTAGLAGRGYRTFSQDEFQEYQKLTDHFTAVAGWTDATVVLSSGSDPARRGLESRATFVTENYFSVLGVRPVMGAGLPTLEIGDPAVAVIGHVVWDQLFGRSPDAVGSIVVVNGMPVTVVGVAPPKFVGFPGYSRLQLWMPVAARPLLLSESSGEYRAVGRLRPGMGLRAATEAVHAAAARSAESVVEMKALDPSADVVPLLAANSDPMFDRDVKLMSVAVGILGLLVLLITCTNVSALMTGLATARRHEIAVRLSLGAARVRLIRQLLTESTLLAVASGALALGIVGFVLRSVEKLIPGIPFEVGITWPLTAFTFGVALTVGVIFGLSPALHATRLGLASALRDSTAAIAASRGRLQRILVVAQIAFTQPLVVLLAAVLFFVVEELKPRDRTELAERLVAVTVRPPVPITGSSPGPAMQRQQLRVAMDRLRERFASTAGVEAAVMDWGRGPPLFTYIVHPSDQSGSTPRDPVGLAAEMVSEGTLNLMGIPLVRGRGFAPDEIGAAAGMTTARRATPEKSDLAVIIGADLAQHLWPGVDPIGRRLQAANDSVSVAATLVVVGVIEDPLAEGRNAGDDFRVFVPPDTTGVPRAVLLRTAGAPQPLLPVLREIALSEIPDLPPQIRILAEIQEEHGRRYRLVIGGLTTAGVMALLLSAIGLYAVVAFAVGQRTREIAVRMAVGARGRQIVRQFVSDGLRLSVIGLALGLPIALFGLRALSNLTDDIQPVALGPVTALAAAGVLLVATGAAWLPARRAAAVDPGVALRSD